MTEKMDMLFTFYAKDREHAERRAEDILKEHPSYERIKLEEYLSGFKIARAQLPGRIDV